MELSDFGLATEPEGLSLVRQFEGLRLSPYLCSGGVATIGYGATRYFGRRRVNLADPSITVDEADSLLRYDYLSRERKVVAMISVQLTPNQIGALTSWMFNVGYTNARRSTLVRLLNRGDYEGASNEFWKWRRAGGVILTGLVKRRAAERELFVSL